MTARKVCLMSLGSLLLVSGLLPGSPAPAGAEKPGVEEAAVQSTIQRLIDRYGEAHAERIRRGVRQAAERWWPTDGDARAFAAFCERSYLPDPVERQATFDRLERVLEQVDGRIHEIRREVTAPIELDTGPVKEVDRLLADLDLGSHVDDDLFGTRVAFLALLNFPVHTLADRLHDGPGWDRRTWAQSRLMDRFASRVPAEVGQEITRALTAAGNYIDQYDIRMDRLITPEGERPFPEGMHLISHWGLRDELASHYGEPDGLRKQRMIQEVMERIVRQEIPAVVIDNPGVLWCPETDEVRSVDGSRPAPAADREPDTRYARLIEVFKAERRADPYTPTAPTFIARRFELDRQIPEKQVEALLVSVLTSREVADLAGVIRKRLGRPLEPFDIWYSGFKSRGGRSEQELDRVVARRYPTRDAFQSALPAILGGLGFSAQKAGWLADHIVVDPSRGAGHAMGAVRREDQAHLRTRVGEGGMNYKGYNIAIHELGHNVEQVFSLNGIDHWALNGVPNNAFTEALAFVFQARDLELLGMGVPPEESRRREALETLWGTFEIGGVALVDMGVWHWLYDHPDASPAELREATLAIARDVWNRYFARVIGVRDQEILAIYSHMIAYALYLPDYPVGHLIAFQVARKLRSGDFGAEFERMARQGRLTPDAWMRGAVGGPISAEALLAEAREALDSLR